MKINRFFLVAAGTAVMALGVMFILSASDFSDKRQDEAVEVAKSGELSAESSVLPVSAGDEVQGQQEVEEKIEEEERQAASGAEETGMQKLTLQASVEVSATDQGDGMFSSGGDKSFWYTLTNGTDKTITGIEYGMLAYDREGNPLKVCWEPLDSGQESSCFCTEKNSSISILPGETGRNRMGEYTVYDADGSWGLVELGTGEEYRIERVLYCIREVAFQDGTLWTNPEYEDWLENCGGKRIPASYLWDYYPCEYTIDN